MMKKLTAILVILVTLLLSACSETPQATVGQEIVYGNWQYDNYDEFQAFLSAKENKNQVLKDFVNWDRVSLLGKWDSVYLYLVPDDYQYSYTFIVPGGATMSLKIYHNVDKWRLAVPSKNCPSVAASKVTTLKATSMCELSPQDTQYIIKRGDVSYLYISSGKLIVIDWVIDGILYQIGFNSDTRINHIDPSSILGRLLSLDEATAKAAFAEIKQSLDAN